MSKERLLKGFFIILTVAILLLFSWPLTHRELRGQIWPDFLANFWSTVIAGSILAPLFIEIYRRVKKFEAKMIYSHGNAEIVADESKIDEARRRITFHIWNKQGKFSDIVYWHVFVEEHRYISAECPPVDSLMKSSDDTILIRTRLFHHIRGRLSTPIYPDTYNDVVSVMVKATEGEKLILYYYLSTLEGLFPKTVKIDSTGHPDPTTFAEVELEFYPVSSPFKPIKLLPITDENKNRIERTPDSEFGSHIIPFDLSSSPNQDWIPIFYGKCRRSQTKMLARIYRSELYLYSDLDKVPNVFPHLKNCITATNEEYQRRRHNQAQEEAEAREKERIEKLAMNDALDELDYS